MPRYFFDVTDGAIVTIDDTGLDLPDAKTAHQEAQRALPGIAEGVLPDGDQKTMKVRVRDEAGETVLIVTLALSVQWGHPGDVASFP